MTGWEDGSQARVKRRAFLSEQTTARKASGPVYSRRKLMRKIVVIFVVALLSLGAMAAAAPSASACVDLECRINCIKAHLRDPLGTVCAA